MTWSAPVIGAPTNGGSGGGDLTLFEPAGSQANDLLIAEISHPGPGAFTAPAGWAQLNGVLGANTAQASLSWWWIKRGASAPGLIFTRAGGSSATGHVLRYRPSTGDFTFSDSVAVASNTVSTTHTLPTGLTTPVAGALVIGAHALAAARATVSFAATDPSGASGATDLATDPTAGQWIERLDYPRSAALAYAMAEADAIRASAGSTGDMVVTLDISAAAALGMAVFYEGSGGSGDTLTLDEQPVRVYEGASGSASVTISGSHTGATDTIEVQIEDTLSGVVVAWQTLQSSVAAGAFSGSVTVPKGGMYIAKARKAGDTATNDAQATLWGVGYVIGGFGQSHMGNLITLGTGTPDSRAFIHNGSAWAAIPSAGEGQNALATQLVAYADAPVALILTGLGGTALASWWSAGKTTNYTDWEAKVTAAGQGLSGFIWFQGDADAVGATARAAYKSGMDAMFAQLRTDYGASLPIAIGVLGGKSGGTDAPWEAIRDAHIEATTEANNYAAITLDAEHQVDGQHFTAAGSAVIGQRIARALAHGLGDVATSGGPTISGASLVNTTTVDVTLTAAGGTDIAPATGITGFQVLDDGTPVTISSAARQDASTVRLALASPIAGTPTVRYGYGAFPDMSGAVLDNSTLPLPLQSTDADVAVTVVVRDVVLSMIDRVGGAPAASVTGLRWAFFDQPLPENFTTPTAVGTGASTDGSGYITLSVVGTALTAGQIGFLVLSDTDGTLADCASFAAPVQVSG